MQETPVAASDATRSVRATRLSSAEASPIICAVAEETPVGLLYNGTPYAVLVVTPRHLDDLAVGFSLTDGICHPSDIYQIDQRETEMGFELDVKLSPSALQNFLARRNAAPRRSFTSCGLCGVESLAAVPAIARAIPLPGERLSIVAIRQGLRALSSLQQLNRATGATHAAAWVNMGGEIEYLREDVGRHNALDKLIGVYARAGVDGRNGFCLITSRCSFEMVQKVAAAGMTALVAISAPTALAIRSAQAANLLLVALARHDSQTVYTGGERLVFEPFVDLAGQA